MDVHANVHGHAHGPEGPEFGALRDSPMIDPMFALSATTSCAAGSPVARHARALGHQRQPLAAALP
ncbi:hypothetical protein CDN99_24100 [Roseateles aquatilis]|uniref:Uncharacterized protein n=1 Tax=Roseateles aquatilis TaxID=431061 RepID=A0A246IVY5_9BURK|nr:hypothetical protein [Roseateles aquatilis]OWQ84381.1 hypothetical protein CDN99_24100 [Roseateles aquatilis]